MVIRVGMIGLSEGNGHPFSFSSVINGFSDSGLVNSGWPGIYDYVRRRDKSEFGLDGMQVTHAWTQDREQTERLCAGCLIPNIVQRSFDMIGKVDAVIIARDDYESHFSMAMPFLEQGLHVFVDKPLALDIAQLRGFKPYLESGKLMSCSGLRYAKELDEPRASPAAYGKIKLIRGSVLNEWERYGVHLLEGILSFVKSRPSSVTAHEAEHMSVAVALDDGSLFQIDALGESPKTFRVDIFGTKMISSHEITDNFSMFRRMLWHFSESIRSGRPTIAVEDTLQIMRVLIAGKIARSERRKVFINEIQI